MAFSCINDCQKQEFRVVALDARIITWGGGCEGQINMT